MQSDVELLPELGTVPAGQEVRIEVRGPAVPGRLVVRRLGDPVVRLEHDGGPEVSLGVLDPGGYGVELHRRGQVWRTAVDVQGDTRARLRYGFVADYAPERDPRGITDLVRRLHLTGVQLYDWAYRHANLLGGGELYDDPLGRPVSLETVRRIVGAVHRHGADALGYAAVYAVGNEEWETWRHDALLQAGGDPYGLGDFLRLVDPAAGDWLEHLGDDLAASVEQVGFRGFHLDQYGYPKRAVRPDGSRVELTDSFAGALDGLRRRLGSSRLVFNQVNDFPTWRTAQGPQDAVYIEPWHPHDTLDDLARTVTRARSLAGRRPVVIAAYQEVYRRAEAETADRSAALTMATLFSHGATQLLAGEADRVLVDPYYVRNHVAEASTKQLLKRWYDFLVEHDELLMAPAATDVTYSYAGEYNDECDVRYHATTVDVRATAGTVWRRVLEVGDRLVVHLINLVGQPDTRWDAPRRAVPQVTGGELRVRRTGDAVPRVRVADPDGPGHLVDVAVHAEGEHAVAQLPALGVWQLVVVEQAVAGSEGAADAEGTEGTEGTDRVG